MRLLADSELIAGDNQRAMHNGLKALFALSERHGQSYTDDNAGVVSSPESDAQLVTLNRLAKPSMRFNCSVRYLPSVIFQSALCYLGIAPDPAKLVL